MNNSNNKEKSLQGHKISHEGTILEFVPTIQGPFEQFSGQMRL